MQLLVSRSQLLIVFQDLARLAVAHWKLVENQNDPLRLSFPRRKNHGWKFVNWFTCYTKAQRMTFQAESQHTLIFYGRPSSFWNEWCFHGSLFEIYHAWLRLVLQYASVDICHSGSPLCFEVFLHFILVLHLRLYV